MEQLNFCYIIDENDVQLRMIEKSIESIRYCFGKYSPTIYIVSLVEKDSEEDVKIRQAISEYCDGTTYFILYFDLNVSRIIPFPTNTENRLGYNVLSRFFLPYILPCEYTYYIDTDTFFTKDIYDKLVAFDHKTTLMRIWNIHFFQDYKHSDHINSGFFYINCNLWKNEKCIFADILDYYVENLHEIRYPNQDCYAWLASQKYKNKCIIENDLFINNRSLFDGVELVHYVGKCKDNFFKMYDHYKQLKRKT